MENWYNYINTPIQFIFLPMMTGEVESLLPPLNEPH